MGRRTGSLNAATLATLPDLAARRLRDLTKFSGVNMLQLKSQEHERHVVAGFRAIFDDLSVPVTVRMDAGKQLMIWAHGQPVPWHHDGATIDLTQPGPTGRTIQEEIAEAEVQAGLHRQLSDLCARQIPPRQWPEAVREIAGDMAEQLQAELDALT